MKKNFLLILSVVILLFSCKTIEKQNQETEAKILFKNLVKESATLNNIHVSGLFKLNGVKEVPQAFINFDCFGNLKTETMAFKISFLKKPLIEIAVDKNDILFINHTGLEYIKLKYENIDFSKFIGVNFNPLELGYFFVGKIPFSENLEMMSYKFIKKEIVMELTNNISKYTITLNENEEIISAKINNQYFDALSLDSIKYTKDDDGKSIPKNVNFSTDDQKIKMAFIIDKISLNPTDKNETSLDFLSKYKEIFDINEIKVKLK